MEYPYYRFSVPVYIKSLTSLIAILKKAQVFAEEKKISDAVILNARLSLDMLPLSNQVQFASDNAKGTSARLAGVTAPVMEDNEKTIDELIVRLEKTIAYLATLKPEQFAGAEDVRVTLSYFPGMHATGGAYFTEYALPNFFFHLTTAYDILRHNGLNIGKADFIGELPFVKD